MYQALYRKWRPMRFADVIGQEHITKTLRAQSASGRLSHAYLFSGPRGTGKTTCARILAKAANCENPEKGDPCNACPSCLGINDGSMTDIFEMDAATYTGVEDIRALREEALYSPAMIRRKVYIIDEVHMLSQSAFNAFLKILEEPPPHVMFVLASTELHKIPATILSRCQRFEFKRIHAKDIAARLLSIAKTEGIPLEPGGAALLSHMADGAMRNALSLLEQAAAQNSGGLDSDGVAKALGLVRAGALFALCDAVAERDFPAALEIFTEQYSEGLEPAALLDQLLCLFRDMLTLGAPGTAPLGGGYTPADIAGPAGRFTPERLLYCAMTIRSALFDIARSPNRRIDAELCLFSLCAPESSGELSALAARLSELERRIGPGFSEQPGFSERPGPAQSVISPPSAPEGDDPPPFDMTGESPLFDMPGEAPPFDMPAESSAEPFRPGGGVPEKETPAPAPKAGVLTDRSPAKAPDGERLAAQILGELSGNLERSSLSYLRLCRFTREGDRLYIECGDGLTSEVLSDRELLEKVSHAAGRVLKAEVTALVRVSGGEAGDEPDGLARLMMENSDIIKFE